MSGDDAPLYLYAVCRAGQSLPTGLQAVESPGAALRLVEEGVVATLASPVGGTSVRMRPDDLHAHQQVVEQMAQGGVVLPFRFGTVAESEDSLRASYLAPNAERLAEMLDSLDGLAEMRVVARYREEAVLAEVVSSDPRLVRLQQRIRSRPPAASYYDRIALGEQVAAALERARARDAAACSEAVRGLVVDERALASGGDDVAFRQAYLVERARLDEVDAAFSAYFRQHESRLDATLIGPLAPWDFTDEHALERVAGRAESRGGHGRRARWAS